jgi:hypothetical protein
MLDPYHRLSREPQPLAELQRSQATTAFTGFWVAVTRRDFLGSTISFVAILSTFIPILMSNIPFRISLTLTTHLVCTWMTVGILVLMILVMLGLVARRWPYIPVEPNSIAGCLYYMCDSEMLDDMAVQASTRNDDESSSCSTTSLMYRYGNMVGKSGTQRVGVNYDGNMFMD